MADQRRGGISWTDETWNPIRGCSRVSPGCEHCYAERAALRSGAYEGLVVVGNNGKPRWTGEVRYLPEKIDEPIFWRRPRKVFVNSMSDLFHEELPDHQIAEVFATMAVCPRHTFQVLTKRAERMCELMVQAPFIALVVEKLHARNFHAVAEKLDWPLPNVWMGVSVEDQKRAFERLPLLAATPAAVRWVSAEPLLEHVSVLDVLDELTDDPLDPRLDWIVTGGESGPGARPFNLAWAYQLQYESCTLDIPFFLKQLGAKPIGLHGPLQLKDWHGKDPAEWPEDLREQEFPTPRRAA